MEAGNGQQDLEPANSAGDTGDDSGGEATQALGTGRSRGAEAHSAGSCLALPPLVAGLRLFGGGFHMPGYFPEEMKQAALGNYLKAKQDKLRAQRAQHLRAEMQLQQAEDRRERIGLLGNMLRQQQESRRQKQLLQMVYLATSANKIWQAIDRKRQAFLSEAQLIRLDASKGIQIGLSLLIAASFLNSKREVATGIKIMPEDGSARGWPYLARAHTCLKQVVGQCSNYSLCKTGGKRMDLSSFGTQMLSVRRDTHLGIEAVRNEPPPAQRGGASAGGGVSARDDNAPKRTKGVIKGDKNAASLCGLRSAKHLEEVLRSAVVLDRLVVKKKRWMQTLAADQIKSFLFAATRGRPVMLLMQQLREQMVKIQRWWKRCFNLHVRRFARLRLVWARAQWALSRRALMKSVAERLRALRQPSSGIRSMKFLPLKSVVHLLEQHLRPAQGKAGERLAESMSNFSRQTGKIAKKCRAVEEEEWAALQADVIVLLQARARVLQQQQRQQQEEEQPNSGGVIHGEIYEDAQAVSAVFRPAPPPQGRGGGVKGVARHDRHHPRRGEGGKGAHDKAHAKKGTAAEIRDDKAQRQVVAEQTHQQLLRLAHMPEAKVDEYAKAGGATRALRHIAETHLHVGGRRRHCTLSNQLAAMQDKYVFMRKRFCDACQVYRANQLLLRECRRQVELYRSGDWTNLSPANSLADLQDPETCGGAPAADETGEEGKEAGKKPGQPTAPRLPHAGVRRGSSSNPTVATATSTATRTAAAAASATRTAASATATSTATSASGAAQPDTPAPHADGKGDKGGAAVATVSKFPAREGLSRDINSKLYADKIFNKQPSSASEESECPSKNRCGIDLFSASRLTSFISLARERGVDTSMPRMRWVVPAIPARTRQGLRERVPFIE
jgi:hypothetical protein